MLSSHLMIYINKVLRLQNIFNNLTTLHFVTAVEIPLRKMLYLAEFVTQDTFDVDDPSSSQDTCQLELCLDRH